MERTDKKCGVGASPGGNITVEPLFGEAFVEMCTAREGPDGVNPRWSKQAIKFNGYSTLVRAAKRIFSVQTRILSRKFI